VGHDVVEMGGRRRSPEHAEPPHLDVELRRGLTIPCPDGVELAADLYLPVGVPPCPVLVTLSPYRKDSVAAATTWESNHYFAASGLATLLVDMRGCGDSCGIPRPPFDPGDADDGLAAVEWAACQPWCNGKVGMWGISYPALVALRTAARHPPHLGAVASVMGMADPELDFVHPGGARGFLGSLGLFGLMTLVLQLTPPLPMLEDGASERCWRDRLQADPYVVDLLRHGPGARSWRERAIDLSGLAVPVFLVSGWSDVGCDGTLRAFDALDSEKTLLLGPWMHSLPHEAPFEPVDFLSLAVAWWKRWLQSDAATDDAPRPPSVSYYVQGSGRWCGAPAWPPPGGATTNWWPSADGRLLDEPAAATGEAGLSRDASVGVSAGLVYTQARSLGLPGNQCDDDTRSLAFTSEPLEDGLAIRGRPTLDLAVRLTRSPGGGSLTARLTAVMPDGTSTFITSGRAPVSAARAALPRPPVDSVAGAAGERSELCRLVLFPTAFDLPAGHRLRLCVNAGDVPRVWPASVDGAVLCGAAATVLHLPTVGHEVGELAVPRPPRTSGRSLTTRSSPLYTVATNAAEGVTRVTVGDHVLMRSSDGSGHIELNVFASATVAHHQASSARLAGKATLRVDRSGHECRVRASVSIGAADAEISGDVAIDGEPRFSGCWRVPDG